MPGRPIRCSVGEFNDFGLEPRADRSRGARARSPAQRAQRPADRRADRGPGAARDRRLAQGRLRAGHGVRGLEHRDRAAAPTRAARATAPRPRRCSRRSSSPRPPVNRIEAQTDVENIAEQRSLEKAGFRPRGRRPRLAVPGRRLPRPGHLLAAARRPVASSDASARRARAPGAPPPRRVQRASVLAVGRRLRVDPLDRAVRRLDDGSQVRPRAPVRER